MKLPQTLFAQSIRGFGIIATVMVLALGSAPEAEATGVNLKRADHQTHSALAYGLGLTGQRLLTNAGISRPLAGLLTMTAIIGFSHIKERTDAAYDRGDIEAGAVGAGVAFGMGFVLEL